ncbi:MAG: hypothetical protein IJ629_06100 [Clostridia bacterium]|nr:hypothetical protein [Clostridia bacterium]
MENKNVKKIILKEDVKIIEDGAVKKYRKNQRVDLNENTAKNLVKEGKAEYVKQEKNGEEASN